MLSITLAARLARRPRRVIFVFRVIIVAMFPAIFLDRDGVIIENRAEYVRRWKDVTFIPQALTALEALSRTRYKIVIVTNQSAVGRGIITRAEADQIGERIMEVIKSHGGHVDGVFVCYHAPAAHCDCRKPRPGLLLQAAAALSIDLSRSIMVGDAISDLQAGQNAGVEQTFLVRTGRGAAQAVLPEAAHLRPFHIYDTLADVVTYLSLNE